MRAVATTIVAAAAAATLVASSPNGLERLPALGWNTWCTIGNCGLDLCYESEIRDVADALVSSGLRDAGYTHVNLDDCWGGPRAPNGTYTWDPDRFPSGIPAIVKYVEDLGFTFGLYTDSGEYTCSQGLRPYKIPGSFGHYADDANTFASWGVKYLKMDWCNTVVNGTQLDPHEVYRNMSLALNQTGQPIVFESCEWGVDAPWEWAGQYMNHWRIGEDHHDQWASTAAVIETAANKSSYATFSAWNYLDFIYTGGEGCKGQTEPGAHCPGQTDDEYRTEFTMWAIVASPIIFATNPINMTAIMLEVLLNADMLLVHQDELGVAGDRRGFASDAGCTGSNCQLWSRPLSNGSGDVGDEAIVLYNAGPAAQSMTFDFSLLGPAWAGQSATGYDLWQHSSTDILAGSYTATVPSHGVVAVRLTAL